MLFKNFDVNIKKGVISRNPITLTELENNVKCEEKVWQAVQSFFSSLKFGTTKLLSAVQTIL